MTPSRRMVDPLLKSSLEVRYTLCTASELHLLAKIIPAFPTYSTLTTRNANFERNTVSDRKARNLWPNSHNYARRFMSQRKRCTSAKVAIRELLIIADV